jgi:carbon monoxide dehydrogenase subunit G
VKLEQEFEVAAPIDRVWQALIDVERVAPSLPGAAVTGRNEDGSYNGTFSVKIGPTSASYAGKLHMEKVDDEAHVAVMQANGTDKRGQGGAKATITSRLFEIDGKTRVEVLTDYHITGRLARFGRGGMIEDISEKLLKQFAGSLQQSLAGSPTDAAKPADSPATAAPPDSPATAEPAAGAASGTPDEPAVSPWAPPGEPQAEHVHHDWSPPGSAPRSEAGPAEPVPATSPFPPTQPAEPLRADAVVASVLADRAKANPLPLVAGLLALLLLIRRRRRR